MNYELMVIVNPKGDWEEAKKRVEKYLKDANVSDIKIDKLGRKTLAYPIAKQTEGEYLLFNFTCEGEGIKALSNKLRLEQEALLRYLLTKVKPTKGVLKRAEVTVDTEKAKVTVKTVLSKKGKAKVRKVSPRFAKASQGKQVSKVSKVAKAKDKKRKKS